MEDLSNTITLYILIAVAVFFFLCMIAVMVANYVSRWIKSRKDRRISN